MIMMQELEKTMAVEGALSLWIDEHYKHSTHISTFDKSNEQVHPERGESALAAYEQAIELAPREAILNYHKGHILEQLGRAVVAETAYEEARIIGHNGLRAENI